MPWEPNMRRGRRKKNSCSQLAAAIRALRIRLGLDHVAMANRLDAPYGSYVRWEYGRSEPGALALVRILKLCPDSESLVRFGIDVPPAPKK